MHTLVLRLSLSKGCPQGYECLNRADLVNVISKFYGKGNGFLKKTPASLKVLVSNHIKSWSIDGLNVAYAQLNFQAALKEWDSENILNGSWIIHTDSGKIYNKNIWISGMPKSQISIDIIYSP